LGDIEEEEAICCDDPKEKRNSILTIDVRSIGRASYRPFLP
jgi:hypothetical protein